VTRPMARIYIDASGLNSEPSGVSRYCRGLIPQLVAHAPAHEFIILRPQGKTSADPLVPPGTARELIVRRPLGDVATILSRPFLDAVIQRYGRPDIYHSLFHIVPLGLKRGRTAPRQVVVTLHDLIWIDHAHQVHRNWVAARLLRQFGGASIQYALRSADHVICNSDATSKRAAAWVAPERRSTIHMAVDESFFEATSPTRALPYGLDNGRPYVAAFGIPKAYKNIRCLVQAFAAVHEELPHAQLVLIGGPGGAASEIAAAVSNGWVKVIPRVTDADLQSIVRHARVFVAPSLVEGFGIPALESMALGTPVVVGETPASIEVAGDAALRFDPRDPAELANLIKAVLCDEELHRQLAERGSRRASAFRWSLTATRTLAVYDRLLGADTTEV
jgi:glycosyltransferase involved in cell wall biosynthesis